MARFLMWGGIPLARATAALAVALVGSGALPAWADDPTRPPNVDAAGEVAPETAGLQLQSVFLPRAGAKKFRPAALINGQRVEVGQRWGEWRLLAVTEASATLAGPEGRQTLTLTPGVAKSPRGMAPAVAPHHRTAGRLAPAADPLSTGIR